MSQENLIQIKDLVILDHEPDPDHPGKTVVFAVFTDRQSADLHLRRLQSGSQYRWKLAFCVAASVPIEEAQKAEAELIPKDGQS